MASTWRCLVADGHRLGRQWLQGKLSAETATRLRQLVVESGAASSSRATKGESLAILLEMFDRSSPVSRRLWCFSWFLFFLCFRFASSKIRVCLPCLRKHVLLSLSLEQRGCAYQGWVCNCFVRARQQALDVYSSKIFF